MKRALAALLALAAVSGRAAEPTNSAPIAEGSTEADQPDPVDQVIKNIYDGKAPEALRAVDDLLPKTEDREWKAYLKAIRGLAFLALKKPAEARTEFAEGTKIDPNTPFVDRLRFLGGMAGLPKPRCFSMK